MAMTATNPERPTREPGRTMKAIVHERYGLDALELREMDRPVLEDDQVLIRVHAASANPVEWYGVTGPPFVRVLGGGLRRPKSIAVGVDVAGRVEAIGKDVREFGAGDEVFGRAEGSWAEFAAAPEAGLALKPANVSFDDAAAIPVAAVTALQALRDHGSVQPGQRVLINGASGGVGTYAVQLAKVLGADLTAVCSTPNVELARSLGADRVVDYTKEDFTRIGERHDLVIDIAGSRSFGELRRVLTPEAVVVVVGASFPSSGVLGPLAHVIRTRLASLGRSQTVRFFVAKINRDDLRLVAELLEAGKVRSVIDRRVPLSEAADALRYLGEGHARGKVIITV
jgi:NADPH:quinone reductase-like Zn-dependent oxidoreductase